MTDEKDSEFSDEEVREIRAMLQDYEARKWFRKVMKDKVKTWGLWIAAVTTAVGLIKGVWMDWIGRH